MSLGAQLAAKKQQLKNTETVVTTPSGAQIVEKKNNHGSFESQVQTHGAGPSFIVSDVQDEDSASTAVEQIEFTYESTGETSTSAELMEKTSWMMKRGKLGDGFSVTPANVTNPTKVAVFVLQKEKNERHYDTFAMVLHETCFVKQIDHDDIVAGKLSEYNTVVFPGGVIFDVDKSLGKDGAIQVNKFVNNGGGFVGVCAGAFLAAASGYNGADEAQKMLSVETSWTPGIGTATVTFTPEAADIFGSQYAGKTVNFYFANGPVFQPSSGSKNTLLNIPISACKVLGTYDNIDTPKAAAHSAWKQYKAAVVAGDFGKGRLVVFGPHPEGSNATVRATINAAVKWSSKKNE